MSAGEEKEGLKEEEKEEPATEEEVGSGNCELYCKIFHPRPSAQIVARRIGKMKCKFHGPLNHTLTVAGVAAPRARN